MIYTLTPNFEILTDINEKNIISLIEKAGRTCYKSEDKISDDSAARFVKMIIKHGHESVIEHSFMTVRFVCSRSISHQLVRHRLASFSEQSQRYCNYKNKPIGIIMPLWLPEEDKKIITDVTLDEYKIDSIRDKISDKTQSWLISILCAIDTYNYLIESGNKPEEARSVLPNDIKTEIIVSANMREWRHILKLRTSPAADPQMRELMIPLLQFLKKQLPTLFLDI